MFMSLYVHYSALHVCPTVSFRSLELNNTFSLPVQDTRIIQLSMGAAGRVWEIGGKRNRERRATEGWERHLDGSAAGGKQVRIRFSALPMQ